MAAATATPTVTSTDETQTKTHLWGSLAVDASPATYTTDGIVCSFAGLDILKSGQVPSEIRAWSEPTSGAPSGYQYQYVRGTTLANGKLVIFAGGGGSVTGNVTVVGGGIGEAIGINPDTNAGVLSKAAATNRTIPIATFLGAAPSVAAAVDSQLANGSAIPAAVSGDTIRFHAVFPRL